MYLAITGGVALTPAEQQDVLEGEQLCWYALRLGV
jgi:hypothetical protein